jgi:hypothetical protein
MWLKYNLKLGIKRIKVKIKIGIKIVIKDTYNL